MIEFKTVIFCYCINRFSTVIVLAYNLRRIYSILFRASLSCFCSFRFSVHSGLCSFNSSTVLNFFTQVLQKIIPSLCNETLWRAEKINKRDYYFEFMVEQTCIAIHLWPKFYIKLPNTLEFAKTFPHTLHRLGVESVDFPLHRCF